MAKSKKQSAVVAKPEPVEAPKKAAKPASVKKSAAVSVGGSLADAFAQSAAFFGKKATYERVEPEPTPEEVAKAEAKAEAKKAAAEAAAEGENAAKKEKKKKKKDKKRKLDQVEGAEGETAPAAEGDAEATPETETETPVSADSDKSSRTIFVGNVSLDATQAALKQFFTACGKVETVRLRFLPVAGTAVNDHGNQKLMMKVCANKKIFTDKRDFCHAYVTFADLASVEKAMKMNHALFMEKKLRIDHENPVVDPQRSVFVGNLSFHVTDEAVWSFFDKELKTDEEPHPVENVRVVRDRDSGAGKGFGYVLLKGKALAAKALSLQGKKLERRDLRVQVCGKRTKNKKGEDTKNKHEGRRASAGAAKRVSLKKQSQPEAEAPPAKKAKFTEGQKATAPGKKLSASAKATVGKGSKFAGAKPGKKFDGAKSGKKVDGSKPGKKFDGVKPKGGKKFDGAKGKKFDAKKGKKGPKVPYVKPVKPKHAARKARQAAEASKAK